MNLGLSTKAPENIKVILYMEQMAFALVNILFSTKSLLKYWSS